MKRFLAMMCVLVSGLFLAIAPPALAAADPAVVATGAKVFGANCASCHLNGNNLINPAKNLKAETLHQYGMDSAEAIIAQVTNGKAAMPAFKTRLQPDQIQAVAAYVLEQSETGWKS